jgi:hypothetical protein
MTTINPMAIILTTTSSRAWGRNFAHIPGARGRFHDLLSWSEVNDMLQKHRLEPPRLRLVRKGEFAQKNDFLRYEGGTVPFVVPEKLSQRLRDGYTLIIDAADDMAAGVMRAAEDFERVLQEAAGEPVRRWREQQGFNRRCDTRHRPAGLREKYWRVYGVSAEDDVSQTGRARESWKGANGGALVRGSERARGWRGTLHRPSASPAHGCESRTGSLISPIRRLPRAAAPPHRRGQQQLAELRRNSLR